VLVGLKDRLMSPEAAAEAMKAYTEEINRLNHERRANARLWKAELAKIEQAISGIISAIEDGLYQPSMKARMQDLETRKADLTSQLAREQEDVPDMHPGTVEIYRRKIKRLTEALNVPEDRAEASNAIRALLEKIVITPGQDKGEIYATLHGDLAKILHWTAQNDKTPRA